MAETHDLYNEVRQLRAKVDDLGAMTETLVRAQSPELIAGMMEAFDNDAVLKETFRVVDGKRSQDEIVDELATRGVEGASQPTVSRRMKRLEEKLHLIELANHEKKGKVFRRTRLDEILGISRELGD
jgi:DNA-binding transcriptional ArsR family regulator